MTTLKKLKNQVIALRQREKTYSEIQKILGKKIPKSTLSCWCRGLEMSKKFKDKIKQKNRQNLEYGRFLAIKAKQEKKDKFLQNIRQQTPLFQQVLANPAAAKLTLAVLYACEGSRRRRASLMFGNSDPFIVNLFMRLLRFCYLIDESKFRCTVQCRADQDIKKLEELWSKTTNIPRNKFYKAQIDPRTVGKPSKNPNYKGVCRIDYFSAAIFNELLEIIKIIQ